MLALLGAATYCRSRTLPSARAVLAMRGHRKPATHIDIEVITLGSGVGVRLFRPVGVTEPGPALLWIHGGGYVLGTAQQDDRLCHQLSKTWASPSHRWNIGWHPNIRIPRRCRTATRRRRRCHRR